MWGATEAESGVGGSMEFQSTHPVWGATCSDGRPAGRRWDFNPRTPCGVRLDDEMASYGVFSISIHAPRVGCDQGENLPGSDYPDFNPRTPCGVRPPHRRN